VRNYVGDGVSGRAHRRHAAPGSRHEVRGVRCCRGSSRILDEESLHRDGRREEAGNDEQVHDEAICKDEALSRSLLPILEVTVKRDGDDGDVYA
jgi:hypothetical protein